MTQPVQDIEKALHRKTGQPATHEMGNLRLVESEQGGDLRLRHPLPLDELLNLEGKLCLERPIFRIGQAQIGKHVSADDL
jgi:hypothetical protein